MSNESYQPRWYEWTIGDRLRVAREQAGYGQREFAVLTGISRASIVNYENGITKPRPPMLAAWCLATGFSREWIITGELPTGPEDDSAVVTMQDLRDIRDHQFSVNRLKVAA